MRIIGKTLISIFIAVHLTVMVTSALPDRSVVRQRILKQFQVYQGFFGLTQPWRMFAPNPSSVNSYIDANITFKDGSTEKWTFPRSSRMSPWERFTSGERFRKYQQENLRAMQKPEMWHDLARFLEREVNKVEKAGKGRVFESIQFYRHSNVIKSPTEKFVEHGKLSTEFKTVSMFQYQAAQKVRYEAKNSY